MHPAITTKPETPVGDAAELIERRWIRRVPVTDRGRLVGIVSRANLVRAPACNRPPGDSRSATSDAEIRDRIVAEIAKQPRERAGALRVLRQPPRVDDRSSRAQTFGVVVHELGQCGAGHGFSLMPGEASVQLAVPLVTSTAPILRSRIRPAASSTVALGGSVADSGF
jgi:CBS domain-containing protein